MMIIIASVLEREWQNCCVRKDNFKSWLYYAIKIFAPDLDNCSEICKKDTRNYKDQNIFFALVIDKSMNNHGKV